MNALRRNLICFLLVVSLTPMTASAAEVSATLDRTRVVEGETVTLTLETDDTRQSLDTDLAVLEAEFEILDQRSETQMSIVNGRQSARVRKVVTLEPRRSGTLTVPSLAFSGGARTAVLKIEVDPAPELPAGELPPVFIETELMPQEGPYYVHAQLALKVRIFYQPGLTEAAINPPEPAQASVRLLDEKPYRAERNGQRYSVLERSYAVFPERSGELLIPPMQLTGRLIERQSDQLWRPSVRGRRVRVESDPLVLTINPRPPEFQGDSWLPARSIDLAQQITDGASIRVGEPVTRTVILDAVGLEEHMLEEPAWPTLENARIYPDQPQGISRDDGSWVLGHREFRYAVVPEQSGELVLPEIRLRWWDTVNDRARVAILPEHRLEVLPADVPAVAPTSPLGTELDAGGRRGGGGAGFWPWLSALLAALWSVTLAMYLRDRRNGSSGAPTPVAVSTEEQESLRGFRAACRSGDAVAARRWLSRWLRHHGPVGAHGSLRGLAEVAGDPALAGELCRLDERGFAPGSDTSWDGEDLWVAFRGWRKQGGRNPSAPNSAEPEFYALSRSG